MDGTRSRASKRSCTKDCWGSPAPAARPDSGDASGQTRPGEPIAKANVGSQSGFRVVAEDGGSLRVQRQARNLAPGGIDHRGDAVVGGAQNPTAILGRAHAYQFQMLLACGAVAEIAVVR